MLRADSGCQGRGKQEAVGEEEDRKERVGKNSLHHSLFEDFLPGFKTPHSPETALVKLKNDIFTASDDGLFSIVVLFDS